MSETLVLLVLNAIILPLLAVILQINRTQTARITSLEGKLDECLAKNSQAGNWQAGQKQQRDFLQQAPLRTGDTKPLD